MNQEETAAEIYSSLTTVSVSWFSKKNLKSSESLVFAGEERVCDDNDLRLVDGTENWNGRLEICKGGVWGAICEEKFEDIDAAVACKQLGFSTKSKSSNLPEN